MDHRIDANPVTFVFSTSQAKGVLVATPSSVWWPLLAKLARVAKKGWSAVEQWFGRDDDEFPPQANGGAPDDTGPPPPALDADHFDLG